MFCTVTIKSRMGPLELLARQEGLVEIVLPGCSRKTETGAIMKGTGVRLLEEATGQIQEFLSGNRTSFTLPLAPRGTPFQLRVWEIIRAIPYGKTMSYGEIAALLGNRNKARAVGGAAHANPLPLVIPCHRVIGAAGSLTGFAGGLNLKERLLARENDSFSQ